MKRVAFYTLGCKVNRYDTEAMMAQFEEADYQLVDFEDQADIYIINTCTVTHQGARKSRKITRRAKRRNPEAILGVVGCYPQVEPETVLDSAEIDFIAGTAARSQIVNFVEQAAQADQPLNFVQSVAQEDSFEEVAVDDFTGRTRASIKIQEGCEQFCSYCIIPYARGAVRSRELTDVVTEARRLAEHGFKEIILTGIHLGEYGADKEELNLEKLLQELIQIDDLKRIRLSSIEGTEVSAELIDLIAQSDKLCRHLHLPLQSGSDRILEVMNRPYTSQEFKEMVAKIKAEIPEIAITTDVIVGFPGSSEQDFAATCQLVEELEFSDLHVFKYSPREGTPAAEFSDQVHSRVKKERSKKLRQVADELATNYQQQFVGTKLQVLLEEQRDGRSGYLTGFTDNYLKVLVDGPDELAGELVEVKLVEKEGKLFGKLEG
ncbi:tRNA (N(6)-L-threonylcarbamoyladenosine(37)-C(2))-methylthiotransferase MtaB [Halanaerobaculum tunisiense]